MKAVINTRYGSPDILEIQQVPKPEQNAGEVLIRVQATTVTRTDCGNLRARPFIMRFFLGLRRPKRTILGMDFAGWVEAVGPGVTTFTPGDRVFGISPGGFGAHAEYLCVSERGAISAMPEGIPFHEAVVCEGALYSDTVLQAFGLKPGHRILIYGASGAIGTAAVQLAKVCGAEVTAVVATQHLVLVESLGADRVIDYTTQDFTQIGETFDFVFDAVGKSSYFRCQKLLKPDGVFASTDLGPWGSNPLLAIGSSITKSNRVIFPIANRRKGFVPFLKSLMERHEFRAVIDRAYPLEAIADAYRYVETGQKVGIVVINVVPADENREAQSP